MQKESEKWRELAKRAWEGQGVIHTSLDVGLSYAEWNRWRPFEFGTREANTLYALLLAEEAEEEEREKEEDTVANKIIEIVTYSGTGGPYGTYSVPNPVSICWSDPEPVQKEPEGPALGNYPVEERRSSFGEKVAQGMRKWADWIGARWS